MYKRQASGQTIDLAATNMGTDGSFEVKLSGSGRYQVRVQPKSDDLQNPGVGLMFDVPEGRETVEQDLVLPEAYVAGTVTDAESGLPLAGARVALQRLGADGEMDSRDPLGGSIATGEDGTYRIEGIRKGTYRLAAGKDGYGAESVPPFELDDDDEKDGMTFALRRASVLNVRVIGDGDRPVEGAFVIPTDFSVMFSGGGDLDAMTDASGVAILRRLGEGAHDLAAVASGCGCTPSGSGR